MLESYIQPMIYYFIMNKFLKKIVLYILILIFFLSLGLLNVKASSTNSIIVESNLDINSVSALLIEAKTGDILYEKNAYEKMYPASTTKMLTAILVLENCYLNELVTVSSSAVSSVPSSYTTAKLQVGEELRVEDLLYAMLIPSGNDAANVLAEHTSGSVSAFAKLMNKKATDMGLSGSHFTNPSGIHDKNLYSTAYDLSIIARYAMNIEKFREIVKTESYTLPPTNLHPNADRTFSNSNLLLDSSNENYYYKYSNGIKTGFTDPSGDCLVASAKKDNIEFIAVCLKASQLENGLRGKFLDCKTLFDFAFANYTTYYTDLQDKNKENQENLTFPENIESTLSNVGKEVSDRVQNLNTNSYRILIKVIAIIIIILAIYLLFFRKKRNHHRLFKRKPR